MTDAAINVAITADPTKYTQGVTKARALAVGFDKEVTKLLGDLNASTQSLRQSNEMLAASLQKTAAAKRNVSNQTRDLNKNLRAAEVGGAALGRTLTRNFTAMAAGVIGVRAAIQSMEDVSAIGRLNQQTGISVENLSALKFAFEQVGVPFAQLEQTAASFSQRLAEGLRDNTSAVAVTLRELGVSARDSQGNLRNLMDMLPDLANAFANSEDGIGKTQAAIALLGQELGPRAIPLLNQGAAGLERLMAKAKELGVVLDRDAIRKAEEFRQTNLQLTTTLNNITRELTLLAGPTIIAAVRALTSMLQNLNEARRAAFATPTDVKSLQTRLEELQASSARLEPFKWLPRQSAMWTQLQADIAATQARLTLLQSNMRGTINPFEEDEQIAQRRLADQAKLREAAIAARDRARADFDTFMQIAGGQATLLESMDRAWMTHAETVAIAIEKIKASQENALQAEIQIANSRRQLNQQYEAAQMQVARTAATALTTLFPKQKAAGIAAAVINTGVAVTEAMKLPFPLNWAQAGLVAAMGVAQIASIRSANLGGGGSVASIGGGGGAGVGDIGGGDGSVQAAAPSRSVHITLQPFNLYSGVQMKELIENINNEVQNGATLISTSSMGT